MLSNHYINMTIKQQNSHICYEKKINPAARRSTTQANNVEGKFLGF